MERCGDCQACGGSETVFRRGLKEREPDYVVALAGNPNTGKSSIFNWLTGLHQHVGNWPGKTVSRAEGGFVYQGRAYRLVDLPGTYSLLSASEDEEVARNYLLFGRPDVAVVVADATALERNLNLFFQVIEILPDVILAVNLMDEARRKGLQVDTRKLAQRLGVPVVATSARTGEGLMELVDTIDRVATGVLRPQPKRPDPDPELESAVNRLVEKILQLVPGLPNARWVAYRLLEGDLRIQRALLEGELLELARRERKPVRGVSVLSGKI